MARNCARARASTAILGRSPQSHFGRSPHVRLRQSRCGNASATPHVDYNRLYTGKFLIGAAWIWPFIMDAQGKILLAPECASMMRLYRG